MGHAEGKSAGIAGGIHPEEGEVFILKIRGWPLGGFLIAWIGGGWLDRISGQARPVKRLWSMPVSGYGSHRDTGCEGILKRGLAGWSGEGYVTDDGADWG